MSPRRTHRTLWTLLAIGLSLSGCAVGIHQGVPSHYYTIPPDSISNACMRGTPNCMAINPKAAEAAMGRQAAEAAASLSAVHKVAQYYERAQVEKALAHCAMLAEARINQRHFAGRSPTRDECREVVGRDARNKPVTRAMQLGVEKHQVALECAQWRLEELVPRHFSLEPRYRYDSLTRQKQLLTREEVQKLLEAGQGAELVGTFAPDVVMHFGQPLLPKAVYEFKFPCPDTNDPSWRKYPDGPPHYGKTQQMLYHEALGVLPLLITPLGGVIR